MAVRKIMLILVPVFILALSIILSSSLFSLPSLTSKMISEIPTRQIINKVELSQWRDETTDPGFNSTVSVGPVGLVINTNQVSFGKTMSSLQPIALHITKDIQVVAEVKHLSPGGRATLRIMNANEPFETFDIAQIKKPGEYRVNLYDVTKWQGDTNFWFEVWLEGKNKSLVLKDLSFSTTDKPLPTVQNSHGKKANRPAGPKGKSFIYQKDFSEDADGWRSNQTDPGFNTIYTLEQKNPRLKLQPNCQNGKFMSPPQGIRGNMTSKTELVIEVQELGGLRAKIDVMETRPPYETKTLLDWISRPGTYKARIAKKTGWKGQKVFWIQVWLEPTAKPELSTAGVVIKRILIRE
jgi:hypothetical protein